MRWAILGFIAVFSGAQAECTPLTADAAAYLKTHPGWRVVKIKDLTADDRVIWRKDRPGGCPGMVQADFDGSGKKFTVLSLLTTQNGETRQVTLALRGKTIYALRKTRKTANPTVLYLEQPGIARQWDSVQQVVVPNQSVSIVQLESSAEQFYYADGRFQSVWTSD